MSSAGAVEKLVALIGTGYDAAEAFAQTLVRVLTVSEQARKEAFGRGKNADTVSLPLRYLFHAELDSDCASEVFFAKHRATHWEAEFGRYAAPDYAWVQAPAENHPALVNVCLIVRVKDSDVVRAIIDWLGPNGAVLVEQPAVD